MYKFAYIDKLPTKKSEKMWFGNHIHQTLKFILDDPYHLPTQAETIRFYAENFDKSFFSEEKTSQNYFENGLKIIESFYRKISEDTPNVVTTEDKFAIPMGEHTISGIFDRVDKIDEESFEIVDYKTGRVPDQRIVDRDLQLTLYDWAAKQKWPHLKNVKLSLYFLAPDLKLSTQREKKHHLELEKTVNQTADQINQQKFEPTPGPLCNYCDFAEFCPLMKEKFRKEKKQIDQIINQYLKFKAKELSANLESEKLKPHIHNYLDQTGAEKLFSDLGTISRQIIPYHQYDHKVVREILEPKGHWLDVTKIDNYKLKQILTELKLTPAEKEKIDKSKKLIRENKNLIAKFKKR